MASIIFIIIIMAVFFELKLNLAQDCKMLIIQFTFSVRLFSKIKSIFRTLNTVFPSISMMLFHFRPSYLLDIMCLILPHTSYSLVSSVLLTI